MTSCHVFHININIKVSCYECIPIREYLMLVIVQYVYQNDCLQIFTNIFPWQCLCSRTSYITRVKIHYVCLWYGSEIWLAPIVSSWQIPGMCRPSRPIRSADRCRYFANSWKILYICRSPFVHEAIIYISTMCFYEMCTLCINQYTVNNSSDKTRHSGYCMCWSIHTQARDPTVALSITEKGYRRSQGSHTAWVRLCEPWRAKVVSNLYSASNWTSSWKQCSVLSSVTECARHLLFMTGN
jgi:hypothetical protein